MYFSSEIQYFFEYVWGSSHIKGGFLCEGSELKKRKLYGILKEIGKVEIREMKLGEIETVRKLRLESYQEYEQFVSSEHWAVLKNTLISENDLKHNAKIYIAELDGQIAGSVVLFPASIQAYDWNENIQDYPEVRMLSVNPMIRGKGIGGALVEHCIKVSKEENNSHIGLHTASFMKKAILLYESKGFERVPELDLEPMNDGIIIKAFIMDLKKDS